MPSPSLPLVHSTQTYSFASRTSALTAFASRVRHAPPAFGIGLDQGLDPAYVIRHKGNKRAIFEAVYEKLAAIRSRFIENLEYQTGVRGLRWRIEAGAALLYPTRTLAVVVWSPERNRGDAIVSDEERREIHRPIELLIKRTMQGGV